MPRQRLAPEDRREQLVATAARMFAEQPYDLVAVEEVASRAGVSRALVYRYFPTKRDLFAAVYRKAADDLIEAARLDGDRPLADQVAAGLDVHIDWFMANRHAVLAANRVLATDPVVQAIIETELNTLRDRVTDALGLAGPAREAVGAVVRAWLAFTRVLCVEWVERQHISRADLRDTCLGALRGALGPGLDLAAPPPGSAGGAPG